MKLLVLVLALLAVPAHAEPTKEQQQEAATRFERGLDAFKDGDYRAALVEFRRAYALAPNFNVLYNIGQVYFQLQDYAAALTSLEQYLADGGPSIPASRRAEVERDLAKLRARVTTIAIELAVAADITIDGVAVGRTPLARPVTVAVGKHTVKATAPGYEPVTRVVVAEAGKPLTVSLALARARHPTP